MYIVDFAISNHLSVQSSFERQGSLHDFYNGSQIEFWSGEIVLGMTINV